MNFILQLRPLALLCFVAIAGPSLANGGGPKPYTLLIYLNGSDLESSASLKAGTQTLRELMSFGSSRTVNVVVETIGTKRWHTPEVSPDATQRWLVTRGGLTRLDNGHLGQQNLAEPKPLSDFIVWGVTHYPAERYALVLWDHGWGPIDGFGQDETNGQTLQDKRRLKLRDLAAALDEAKRRITRTTGQAFGFEMIGFDACLLGSLEVATAISPFAKFMLGSEDLEPLAWDYQAFDAITRDPTIAADELGRRIVDGYIARAKQSGYGGSSLTLSLIDLAKVRRVGAGLASVAGKLNLAIDTRWVTLSKARDEALQFATIGYDLVDLGDLINALNQRGVLNPAESAEVTNALDAAVVYHQSLNRSARAKGLSVYHPHTTRQDFAHDLPIYQDLGFRARYARFVARYADRMAADQDPVRLIDSTPRPVPGAAWRYRIRLAPGEVERLRSACAVLEFREETRWRRETDCNHVLVDPLSGQISYVFDRRWPRLNGRAVDVSELLDLSGGKVEYRIPIKIHDDGHYTDAALIATYDTAARAWQQIKTAELEERDEDGNLVQVSKGDVLITPNTRIRLKHLVMGADGVPVEPPRYSLGEVFVVGNGGLVLDDTAVPAGRYRIGFELTAVNRTKISSGFAAVSYP